MVALLVYIASVPFLDLEASREIVVRVLDELYAKRHSPVPGALVKAQIIAEAANNGTSFNERNLGFKNFLEFVKTVPEIAVQIRIGSDMLLAPATAGEILSAFAGPLPRLRRDFWRAFIEFPVPNTLRLYDLIEDKIFYEDVPTQRKGIIIDPVSRDTQLAWRQSFSEEQPDNVKSELLASFNGTDTAIFNDFARRLRERPSVLHAWNRYLQKQITDHVAAWATKNGVSEDRWCSGESRREGGVSVAKLNKPQTISQRAELYNFFDNLPIEDLLQLRVPLEWVLKVTREKK